MAEKMTVRKACPICGEDATVEVDAERYERFTTGRANREPVAVSGVQVLFPELSAADREILISGTHDECFNALFGEEEG